MAHGCRRHQREIAELVLDGQFSQEPESPSDFTIEHEVYVIRPRHLVMVWPSTIAKFLDVNLMPAQVHE